jgi:hypothetical protein
VAPTFEALKRACLASRACSAASRRLHRLRHLTGIADLGVPGRRLYLNEKAEASPPRRSDRFVEIGVASPGSRQ